MNSVKISATIITLNEDKMLPKCLASLQGIVDEIVVVDSFSTDRTCDIAKEYGAIVIQNKFEGHIEQKNFAISAAHFDIILSLDADEILSEELKKSILGIKENWNANLYSFNRLNNYCGHWVKYCGWYPDKKVRLFDRRITKWGGINPHDRIDEPKGEKIIHLNGDLKHYSFFSIHQHIHQINYFTEIMAKEYVKKGKKAPLWKLFLSPSFKFLKDYFLRLGFLDGYYGFVICYLSAVATFVKYLKVRELGKRD